MLAERRLDKTEDTVNPTEFTTPGKDLLDLSLLKDRRNFHQTLAFLNKAKEKFKETDWKGGIGVEEERYAFDDVKELVIDINRLDIPDDFLSANDQLAFAQAAKFAGARIPARLIARLYERAQREYKISQRVEGESLKQPEISRNWLRKAAFVAPFFVPVAIVLAAKPWEAFQTPKIDINTVGNSPRAAEVFSISINDLEERPNQKEEKTETILSSIEEMVESFKKPIPLVEELDGYKLDNLWGFNFANPEVKNGEEIDPSKFLILEWDSERVLEANGGNPVRDILYPVNDDTGGGSFGSSCLNLPDKECAKQFSNYIVVSGHSGVVENLNGEKIELPMEPLRAFIEGHKLQANSQYSSDLSKEEREESMEILEEERATLSLGDHQAKVQTVTVRIEEADRDRLYGDWSKVVEIALEYDPHLGEKVNLEKPFLVFVTSGRKIDDDKLSGEEHSLYSSSANLTFACEALSRG